MLRINKNVNSIRLSYKLQFLFRVKNLDKKYLLKKKKQSSIILRSPKHFNIGKQKITNINYKVLNLSILLTKKINLNFFLSESKCQFKVLNKLAEVSTYIKTQSIKISLKTKFIIKWLGFYSLIPYWTQ